MQVPRRPEAKKEGYGFICITCRVGESLVLFLPDGREVTIVATRQRACGTTLGVEAPEDIKVLRGSLVGKNREPAKISRNGKGRISNDPKYAHAKKDRPVRCYSCKSLDVVVSGDAYSTHTCISCKRVWIPRVWSEPAIETPS